MQRNMINQVGESGRPKEPSTSDLKSHEVARLFLTILHQKCPGQLELRVIHPKIETGACRKYWPSSVKEAVEITLRESQTANVYFGASTRRDRNSGKKSNLSHYPGVWVDIDFKDFKSGEKEARALLDKFSLKPTLIVHTGGGFHSYWLLDEPVLIAAESIPQLERLNKDFAKALGGDHCHSIDHIMRIPETINWPDAKKRQRGRVPAPVRLLSWNGPRYTLEELEGAIPPPDDEVSNTPSPNQGKSQENENSLPARFLALLKHNPKIQAIWEGKRKDLKDQSRSAYDMALTNQLAQHGFTDQETKAILCLMPSGRGAKAKDEYHDLTIGKARSASSQDRLSAANLADRYLFDRQLHSRDGLRIRWHRETWFRYNGMAFDPLPIPDLQADVAAYLQSNEARHQATKTFVNNILLNLQARCVVPSSVSLPVLETQTDWVESPNALVMANGIVDLQSLFNDPTRVALKAHTPHLVSTLVLPFPFEPQAQCPRWLDFLKQILPDEESRNLLSEIFGYCLTYDTSHQKFFLFEGIGGNGKGVVTGILTLMLDAANISTIPLELFAAPHGLEVTLGKLVNITSEVGDLDRVAEGLLKQFTGGDLMHFNPKYKHPFSSKPTAKLIITTNVRPPFRDRSEGIWRRLILVPFPVTIQEAKQNKHLIEELAVELPGIFNWAVSGYISLRQRGHFIEPAVCLKAKREFRLESNPARAFLHEHCVADLKSTVLTSDIYFEYDIFCKGHGYMPLNDANFGKELRRVFPQVTRVRLVANLKAHRPPAYKGIRLLKSL